MESRLRIKMTTKQKCDKLAKVLETVAVKLRDTDIGVQVWEEDAPTMQSFVGSVHMFLRKARDIASSELSDTPKSKTKSKSNSDKDKDNQILNDWPDVIQ